MTKILLGLILSTAFPVVAGAQDAPPPQPPAQDQAAPQGNLRGNWLQADQTRSQAQQRADMMFQRLDTNHDGVVTRQELDAAMAQFGGKGGGGGRFAAMADRLFSQGDSVTQAQFEAQALQRFDRQDLNHDGVVTADERQQARGQRKQERGN